MSPVTSCPCGSGLVLADCCGRFHTGAAAAPTAEALMRSRYSAFAVGDPGYLLRTWHTSTRPADLELDDDRRWTGLELLSTSGGAFGREATVSFAAHYDRAGRAGVQQERSRFLREGGRWFYLDGESLTPGRP